MAPSNYFIPPCAVRQNGGTRNVSCCHRFLSPSRARHVFSRPRSNTEHSTALNQNPVSLLNSSPFLPSPACSRPVKCASFYGIAGARLQCGGQRLSVRRARRRSLFTLNYPRQHTRRVDKTEINSERDVMETCKGRDKSAIRR